jgi:Bacterial capsule synthesis protein PGA_cap
MKNEVSILFTGDYCPVNRIEELSDQNQYVSIFNDLLPIIQGADLSITNFEAPATHTTTSIEKSGPVLKVQPKALQILKNAGFGLVTLANNHIMDYGEAGIRDTLDSCKQYTLESVGAGRNNSEARRVYSTTIKNTRIAIVNVAENEFGTTHDEGYGAAPLDPVQNYYDIQRAKQSAEYVFVVVHGGHEMYSLPSPRMAATYRFFIDIGADAVIGHHTHCISGFEWHKGKPIFYSLGNFVFDDCAQRSGLWTEGMAVLVKITDAGLRCKILPFHQNNARVGVHLMKGNDVNGFFSKIDRYNEIIQDDLQLRDHFNEYCHRVRGMYDLFLEPYSNKYMQGLRRRYLFPSLVSSSKLFLNLMRCEAHRDILRKILSS